MGKTTLPVTAFDRHRGSGCPLTPATVGHLVIDTTGAGIPKKLDTPPIRELNSRNSPPAEVHLCDTGHWAF